MSPPLPPITQAFDHIDCPCRGAPSSRSGRATLQGIPKQWFLTPLFPQHIPTSGAHLVRYYGWYSNKARGMRRKAAQAEAAPASASAAAGRPNRTWAMLIKRVYEVDPLSCPRCGESMRVVAFIEPPQEEVIARILRHCGLWRPSSPRPPPADEPGQVVFVDEDTFWATF